MIVINLVLGLVLLVVGAEALVRGASRLASSLGISPVIIGLTVVALGTSAPEISTTAKAAFSGHTSLALGNIVGSNILNILLILGLAALIRPLRVAHQLIRWDVPLMIGLALLLWLFGLDGRLGLLDGVILLAGMCAYLVLCVMDARIESGEVRETYAQQFQKTSSGSRITQIMIALMGLVLLVGGAQLLVGASLSLARILGLSELVIGLTIVAIGTSLPEVAASLVAALRGQRDLAVGNVVGSNIFNILAGLGLGAVLTPEGIAVDASAMGFDIPVMIATSIACLPIFLSAGEIARWEGALFLVFYAVYTSYLVLAGMHHDALPVFNHLVLGFVIPLTAVTLFVIYLRSLRQSRKGKQS